LTIIWKKAILIIIFEKWIRAHSVVSRERRSSFI
jgi:hypothetical protein